MEPFFNQLIVVNFSREYYAATAHIMIARSYGSSSAIESTLPAR